LDARASVTVFPVPPAAAARGFVGGLLMLLKKLSTRKVVTLPAEPAVSVSVPRRILPSASGTGPWSVPLGTSSRIAALKLAGSTLVWFSGFVPNPPPMPIGLMLALMVAIVVGVAPVKVTRWSTTPAPPMPWFATIREVEPAVWTSWRYRFTVTVAPGPEAT
jgi:hypothetical protein